MVIELTLQIPFNSSSLPIEVYFSLFDLICKILTNCIFKHQLMNVKTFHVQMEELVLMEQTLTHVAVPPDLLESIVRST